MDNVIQVNLKDMCNTVTGYEQLTTMLRHLMTRKDFQSSRATGYGRLMLHEPEELIKILDDAIRRPIVSPRTKRTSFVNNRCNYTSVYTDIANVEPLLSTFKTACLIAKIERDTLPQGMIEDIAYVYALLLETAYLEMHDYLCTNATKIITDEDTARHMLAFQTPTMILSANYLSTLREYLNSYKECSDQSDECNPFHSVFYPAAKCPADERQRDQQMFNYMTLLFFGVPTLK